MSGLNKFWLIGFIVFAVVVGIGLIANLVYS